MNDKHLCTVFLLALLIPASTAFPYGIRVDDKGAHATARGNTFVATADDPSALYYNPAGITQIDGAAIQAGLYNLHFDVDYKNEDGESFTNDAEIQPVPNFHATLPLETSPLTFGFTAHIPFGLENNWPDDTSFSTLATESQLRYLRYSPVLAWEADPRFSVAAGLTINDVKTTLRRNTTPDPSMGEFRFKGSDQAFGYILGAHWRPSPEHAVGAVYRSRTTFDLSGTTSAEPFEDEMRASATFPFPDIIALGYSFRPDPKWNFEFAIDWTNWDVLDTVTVKREEGEDLEMAFNWKSSFIYSIGVTRYLGEDYRVSAGYLFSENSVPDDHFNPAVPDADRHFLSAGLGYGSDRFQWDLAYQFGYSPTRRVRDSEPGPPPFFESADGDYKATIHAVALSLGYSF